jgi:transcriptional regulator with XRE-family HTH domain
MNELEERWRELGEFIREQRRLGELSLRKLAELAGVSNPYLSQIERGLRKPSADILRQIAGALHISAETLYVRAGILDEDSATVDLVAEIRRDAHLDEEQKRALVHIYQSFRAERAARVVSAGAGDLGEALTGADGDGDGPAEVPADVPDGNGEGGEGQV